MPVDWKIGNLIVRKARPIERRSAPLLDPRKSFRLARRAPESVSRNRAHVCRALREFRELLQAPLHPMPPFPGRPRIRRPIGHPAMAGAIGLSLRRFEAAIGEILFRRIAERPFAVALRDRLQSNLRISPTWASAKTLLTRSRGNAGAAVPRHEMGVARGNAARRGRSTPAAPGAECFQLLPVSLIPIRFALPITELRDGAPIAAAIALALLPSSANCLRASIASAVQMSTPMVVPREFMLAIGCRGRDDSKKALALPLQS